MTFINCVAGRSKLALKHSLKHLAGLAGAASVPLSPKGAGGCCLLLYHRVAPRCTSSSGLDSWNVEPGRLDQQLGWIAQNAVCVPLDGAIGLCRHSGSEKPTVCLTFDDGFANFYSHVLPLLKKYALPATLFVPTGFIGSRRPFPFDQWGVENSDRTPESSWIPISWTQLEKCLESGLVTVGSHSHLHKNGLNLDEKAFADEVGNSMQILSNRLGVESTRAYAYPYGSVRLGQVPHLYMEAVKRAGFKLAVTTDPELARETTNHFAIPRVEVHTYDNPLILSSKIRGLLWPHRWLGYLRKAQRGGIPERHKSGAPITGVSVSPDLHTNEIQAVSGSQKEVIGVTPKVSIIIPCKNEAHTIRACLESALGQQKVLGGFEVICADGGSNDGTIEILNSFVTTHSNVRIINNPQGIVSSGLNAAIESSHGEIIIRMDAHTDYHSEYVSKCILTLLQTGADNVGGPARTKTSGYVQRAVAAAYHSPLSVGGAKFHQIDYSGYVDTVPYGCWHRSCFDKFGLFDVTLVRNQDDEHNLRIRRMGGRIYQSSDIKSWYRPRETLCALLRQYAQYGYWKVFVIRKHRLPASWRHLVPGLFILTILCLMIIPFAEWVIRTGWAAFGHSIPPSPLNAVSKLGLLALSSTYGLTVFTASVLSAANAGWELLPILLVVFPCYHFGYGYGFIRGVVNCWCRRNRGGDGFNSITRGGT